MLPLWMATAVAAEPVLQVGFTAPYAVMPGVRVGLRNALGTDARRTPALVVGADVATYVDPGDHVSALLGGTVGVRWLRDNGLGFTVEAGLAAVTDRQTLAVTVDLASGDRTRDREWRAWILPTVTGRVSWRNLRRFGGYTGLSLGQEIGFGRNGAFVVTLDAGLRARLGKEGGA